MKPNTRNTAPIDCNRTQDYCANLITRQHGRRRALTWVKIGAAVIGWIIILRAVFK